MTRSLSEPIAVSTSVPRSFLQRYISLRSPDWVEIGEPGNFEETAHLLYTSTRGIMLRGDRIGTVPGPIIEMRSFLGDRTETCLVCEPFEQLTIKQDKGISVEFLPRG